MNAFTWALLAAVCWGMAPLLEKIGLKQVAPLAGLFYRSIGVLIGLVVLCLFLVKPQQIKAVDGRSALLLIGGGLLASFLGQICFYNSLKLGEVSRMVPVSGSYPLLAFLLGVLLLGEALTPLKAAGALLIVGGLWLLKVG